MSPPRRDIDPDGLDGVLSSGSGRSVDPDGLDGVLGDGPGPPADPPDEEGVIVFAPPSHGHPSSPGPTGPTRIVILEEPKDSVLAMDPMAGRAGDSAVSARSDHEPTEVIGLVRRPADPWQTTERIESSLPADWQTTERIDAVAASEPTTARIAHWRDATASEWQTTERIDALTEGSVARWRDATTSEWQTTERIDAIPAAAPPVEEATAPTPAASGLIPIDGRSLPRSWLDRVRLPTKPAAPSAPTPVAAPVEPEPTDPELTDPGPVPARSFEPTYPPQETTNPRPPAREEPREEPRGEPREIEIPEPPPSPEPVGQGPLSAAPPVWEDPAVPAHRTPTPVHRTPTPAPALTYRTPTPTYRTPTPVYRTPTPAYRPLTLPPTPLPVAGRGVWASEPPSPSLAQMFAILGGGAMVISAFLAAVTIVSIGIWLTLAGVWRAPAPDGSAPASLASVEIVAARELDRTELPRALDGASLAFARGCRGLLRVVGHTCALGTPEDNERIGLERAIAVRRLLLAEGFSPSRIEVRSAGGRQPVANNETEEGRRLNRRVTLSCVTER